MNTFFSFVTNCSTTMMLLLRRTLVHPVRCSALPKRIKEAKAYILLCVLCAFVGNLNAQTWIWYPGDFEINLANKMQHHRTELNTLFPVFGSWIQY
jgi:hypothetical protein